MSEVWTAQQYREHLATAPAKKRGHKYGAKAVEIDGHYFPSTLEGNRYRQLKLLERGGEIIGLALQPRFILIAAGQPVGEYVADFSYMERSKNQDNGPGLQYVVEDAKGVLTPVYKLKRKMFRAQFPHITFKEITARKRNYRSRRK